MLFVERDDEGNIAAIRQGPPQDGLEPVSLLDDEILLFLQGSGDINAISQLLTLSDKTIIRVVEDLIDLLISKKIILFTELPAEAQDKIRQRKRARQQLSHDGIMVDDII